MAANRLRSTDGGVAATHPAEPEHILFAGPATGDERNCYRCRLAPLACWRVEDMRFEFDSSFVRPEMSAELAELDLLLAEVRAVHPGSPPAGLTVFGHADPTGDDEYNKSLSGRRAQAVYGMLIRDADLWEDLYAHPQGGDNWQTGAIQTMVATTGRSTPWSSGARKELYLVYMNAICPLHLQRTDFLGYGADPGGRADYQGCSEFNPTLVFSKEEEREYISNTVKRNARHPRRSHPLALPARQRRFRPVPEALSRQRRIQSHSPGGAARVQEHPRHLRLPLLFPAGYQLALRGRPASAGESPAPPGLQGSGRARSAPLSGTDAGDCYVGKRRDAEHVGRRRRPSVI
jgi:hypothetical protein